jgi:hypothetical protein
MNRSQKIKFAMLSIVFVVLNCTAYTQTLRKEYSTFLGGSSEDRAHGMALDAQGNIYLTAPIQSTNFPTTPNALNRSYTGVYVAKINSTGDSLVFSTYLGANGGDYYNANYAHGVAVDKDGCIYIAGNTTNANFPTTSGAFDRTFHGPANRDHGDAFVVKLNPEGNRIIYSTFIGGKGMDICGKIAVDTEGNAYIIGSTSSTDFPVTTGAFDTTFNGGDGDGRDDIFAAKLNATGSKLLYCTYIGGSGTDQYGQNILIDDSGCVYFVGSTSSSNFPTTATAYDTSYNGGSGIRGGGDAVLVKLNASGTALEYSTFIGGSGDDFGSWVSLDNQRDIYVCGTADSAGFPTTPDAYSRIHKNNGGFFAKFNSSLSQILYSTLWDDNVQAIAVHESGAIVITGLTESNGLPVTLNALYTIGNGSGDIYISIFDPVTKALTYCTYFGGNGNDVVSSMILDHNSIYLSGNTASKNFPVTHGSYDTSFNGGTNEWGGDAFITKFILSDSTTSVGKSGSNIPDNIRLNQNYPNPFNPSTTIQYSLAKSSFVKLNIYNLLGQKIRILQNSFQSAGKYSLVWNATDEKNNSVSSGIYFYSLSTIGMNLQKKMILIK